MNDVFKCKRCGTDLNAGANFCFSCGEAVASVCDEILCEGCGSVLMPEQAFCSVCGRKRPAARPVHVPCKECGEILTPEQTFCPSCGAKRPRVKARVNPTDVKKRVLAWIKHSLALSLSILLLIFAFLPVATVSFSESGYEGELGVTPIDNVVFCFDAMQMLDEEELLESKLVEKIGEIVGNFGLGEELLDIDEDDLGEATKLALRLYLKSEETPFVPQYALSGLLCLGYVLFAVALFAVTVTDFIFFAVGREKRKLWRSVLVMLAAIPAFALGTSIVCVVTLPHLSFIDSEMSASGAAVTLIVLSVLVLAYFAVEHFFLGEKRIKANAAAIVKRSLSIVACLLMVFSVFLPMISYGVKTTFSDARSQKSASRKLGIEIFESFALSESDLESFENEKTTEYLIREYVNQYKDEKSKDFRDGSLAAIDEEVIVGVFSASRAYKITGLISLIPLFVLLTSLLGAVLLWQNLIALVCEASPNRAVTVTAKVLGLVTATLGLALVIVFLAVSGFNLKDFSFSETVISLRLSAGAVIMLLFAVLATCVPMRKRKY